MKPAPTTGPSDSAAACRALGVLVCLGLTACGGGGNGRGGDTAAAIECAPFARALTGVSLSGAAADWWREAGGQYARSHRPVVGSLLVLRRSSRLPSGHVAVVSRVLSRREILVTQANWVHHRVSQDQPVEDVSPAGDWTRVRVWWPPADQMGIKEYAAFGFIQPRGAFSHDQLISSTPSAIRIAEGER
ncbi:MAG TPA: CHAP domain-containing protein [Acetobacteraceae bacterium]|nr:CHAP domain-containing protein [Acetobacteraceae bacterium]